MWGALVDAAFSIPSMMHAEEMQNDAQAFNSGEAQVTRDFNSAEAVRQREWVESQTKTSYQRGMEDMRRAGLNPMLASKVGGADTGSGSSASGSNASSGISGGRVASNLQGGMLSQSQMDLNSAAKTRTEAETTKIGAETEEIRARTPTHSASIAKTYQDIAESKERVEKLMVEVRKVLQEERTSAASAELMSQQTRNLIAEVPRIAAQIGELRSRVMSQAQEAASGRAHEQEIVQRTKANLPLIDKMLKEVEEKAKHLAIPRQAMDAAANNSFIGAFGALMRALPVFGHLMK